MSSFIDVLEKRVVAAVGLIASLRETVERLARELEKSHSDARAETVRPPEPLVNPSLVEELERLRAERAVIRDSIRGLLKEIDRVSW